MTCNVDKEDIMAQVPQDVDTLLSAVPVEKIRNDYRQATPLGFRAVRFKRVACIGFAAGANFIEEPEYFEDTAFASLRRQLPLNLFRISNNVNSVEVGQADVA